MVVNTVVGRFTICIGGFGLIILKILVGKGEKVFLQGHLHLVFEKNLLYQAY